MPPKQKTFAEKMLKSKKPVVDHDNYRVIRARVGEKGGLRYENTIVRVRKDADENKALGI